MQCAPHATRTSDNSGHGERSPDEYASVGTCLALRQNLQDAHGQNDVDSRGMYIDGVSREMGSRVQCNEFGDATNQR